LSAQRTQLPTTEGVLLIRRDGATMAVHLTAITVILEAVFVEHPDVEFGFATLYGGTTLDRYEVEATGQADRITMWHGPDPFDKPEIENPRAEVMP
jgi:hypothetical protein